MQELDEQKNRKITSKNNNTSSSVIVDRYREVPDRPITPPNNNSVNRIENNEQLTINNINNTIET